jgi:hypothetical protein
MFQTTNQIKKKKDNWEVDHETWLSTAFTNTWPRKIWAFFGIFGGN